MGINILKLLSSLNKFVTQIFKYGFVGILLNTLGFILFLILTSLGLEPKFVVAFMYPLIVLLGFKGHKRFTFSSSEETQGSLSRFFMAHLFGYFLNLAILFIFVDILSYRHQLVQLMAIFFVSAYLFIIFKFFVFRN